MAALAEAGAAEHPLKPTSTAAGPIILRQKSNPFASATAAAQVAIEPVPLNLSAVGDRGLAIKTPSPKEQQQHQPAVAVRSSSVKAQPANSNSSKRRVRFACCMQPAVLGGEDCHSTSTDGSTPTSDGLSPMHSGQHSSKQHSTWQEAFSPKKSLRAQVLMQQGSSAYSDAEW